MRRTIAGSEHQLTTTMTPEEQRIAIAEACGWTEIKVHDNGYMTGTRPRQEMEDAPQLLMGVPHYPKDANAALQLCDRLAAKGWNCELSQGTDKTWECTFKRIASEDSPIGTLTFDHDTAYEIYYHPADTLPEAISGAFLRTIGKWKD